MREAVIVSTARTPIGKAFRGAFNDTDAPVLAGVGVREAVRRAGVDGAEVEDLVEPNLDSEPVRPTEFRLYSERVIHGEIYKARPDVNAVCHHHSHAVLPFCISGQQLVPVFHLPAVIGHVPFWDQRDEFGDTNMLVVKPEEGASLARALGANWMVLMRRHGATVAGKSIPPARPQAATAPP